MTTQPTPRRSRSFLPLGASVPRERTLFGERGFSSVTISNLCCQISHKSRLCGMQMASLILTSPTSATMCSLCSMTWKHVHVGFQGAPSPGNALGKMQLRSYMNGHSRLREPLFPFSVDKGFGRSHRMQRKQYRGLSKPLCVHGIEVVRSPNLLVVSEADCKKWTELTGRDLNFSVPLEANDFGSWRNLPSSEFELERPLLPLKSNSMPNSKKLSNGADLHLSTLPSNNAGASGDIMNLSPQCSRRSKDLFPHGTDEDCFFSNSSFLNRPQDMEIHLAEPSWVNEFTGVMRLSCGPVTAAKTIYEEDEQGYLIMVSLPFTDWKKVRVSWRNNLTYGIVKISCVSTARMPCIKRHDRTFKLTDPSPEHCPPGEFVREIPLATLIPEDANLEAYYDEIGTSLEITVPKHRVGSEEYQVHVCMRHPHLGSGELPLS